MLLPSSRERDLVFIAIDIDMEAFSTRDFLTGNEIVAEGIWGVFGY